jgi:predicted amidohydrolase YtcJ
MVMDRRHFLAASAVTAASVAVPDDVARIGDAGFADLVVVDANVLTVDSAIPQARAFAAANGRIVRVGSTRSVRSLAGVDTTVIEGRGRTVVPGFIDPHLHPRPVYAPDSPYEPVDLSPERVPTIAAMIAALRAKAAITPPDMWVLGRGYNDAELGRHPTRADLDQATTDHPVRVTHASGHVSVVSSLVLRNAGVGPETPDPAGGAFDRDSTGAPNGVVRESAGRVAAQGNPPVQQPSREEQAQGMVRCLQNFARRGLTSVGVAGSGPEQFALYQGIVADAAVRIGFMFVEPHFAAVRDVGLRLGFGDERLRVTSIKLFHGNSLSGRTCWLSEPYSDRPGYYGIPPARSQDELNALIKSIHTAGFQVAVHSNGDREIDMVLTAIEGAQAAAPRADARHRIEHCSVTTPTILDRIKRAGVVAVFHSYMREHGNELASYGPERLERIHPFRTALDMQIACSAHSDWPVSAFDPLIRMQDLVTRRASDGSTCGGSQRITATEALRVLTAGPAYATHEETLKGSIRRGALADFVILDADPTRVDPSKIAEVGIEATYMGGRPTFTPSA